MNSSVVQYFGKDSSSCGYCKSLDDSISYGMWAHALTVQDYQCLIDRGWRRCGLYCYKPVMNEICCPAYTIRCDALQLSLTKSQKKLLKKMTKFLKKTGCEGSLEDHQKDDVSVSSREDCAVSSERYEVANIPQPLSSYEKMLTASYPKPQSNQSQPDKSTISLDTLPSQSEKFKPGLGADGSRPKCQKAKFLRMQRRKEKMEKQGLAAQSQHSPETAHLKGKQLEEYIAESETDTTAGKLTLTIVPSCSDEKILQECWALYKKYQTVIHNDSEDKCDLSSFTSFLVTSPLQPFKDSESPPCGYGSFHQLYRLDGKLIAVGVIDVLPKCISSVYFFYDPQYSHLSLGTYGSLRELELVRQFSKTCPNLNQYYLGFYIHSCSKMRYKGNIRPSYLLCPEVYSWHPIELCLRKLDEAKYSRLNDDASAHPADDKADIDNVPIFTGGTIMPFSIFRINKSPNGRERAASELREYAKLVGGSMARKMFYRLVEIN